VVNYSKFLGKTNNTILGTLKKKFIIYQGLIVRSIISNKQFLKYSIIGLISASFDFCIFTSLLNYSSINYLLANAISINCGILSSFTLNRQLNFKIKDKTMRRFSIFYLIGIVGLAISTGSFFLLVEKAKMNVLWSKIFLIVIVAIFQFMLNKSITFKINNT